jgi:outer membrane biosynthesis protein TonB
VREAWLRAQDRKRTLLAWGLVSLAYLLAFGILVLRGLYGFDSLSSGMGTIQVRIGSPEGEDEFSRVLPALAAAGPGEAPAPTPEAAAEANPPPPSPPPAPAPDAAASAAAPAAVAAKPAPAAASSAAPPPPKAASPTSPSSKPASPSPSQTGAKAVGSVPGGSGTAPVGAERGAAAGSPTGTGPVSLKGSEEGNSFETNFDTGSGKIGRSLYVPIYLYMPLPKNLDKGLYDAMPASKTGLESAEIRKARLRDLYDFKGTLLTLKSDLPLGQRPSVWVMLQDAGYLPSKADYKSGRVLKPVVIEFSVGAPVIDPQTNRETTPLLSATVVTSSGYPEIDEAVLFGFKQAGFRNDSKGTVKGRFTYNFTN